MRSLLITLCAAAVLSACAGPSHKERRNALTPLRAEFDAADKDGDGSLTRQEAADGMPGLVPLFDTIDTDGNGRISAAELRSYLEWQRILAKPPADGRGRLR